MERGKRIRDGMKWNGRKKVRKMMGKNNSYSSSVDRKEHEETSLFLKITFFEQQQFQMITTSIII